MLWLSDGAPERIQYCYRKRPLPGYPGGRGKRLAGNYPSVCGRAPWAGGVRPGGLRCSPSARTCSGEAAPVYCRIYPPSGRLRHVDGDPEIVASDCGTASSGWLYNAEFADSADLSFASASKAETGSGATANDCIGGFPPLAVWRTVTGGNADCPGGLDSGQLRGRCLYRPAHLPGTMVA